jgi:MYXO-CTERM domain-containing protein
MTNTIKFVLSAGLVAACSGASLASIVGDPLTITASSAQGTASFTVRLQDGTYNPDTGDFSYSRQSPIVLVDDSSGRTIGTVSTLNFSIIGDPQVNLAFSAVAGNASTLFTFASGLNVFAPLFNPAVSGVASMTITDNFGNDGATEHGNVFGPFGYGAFYNGASIYAQRLNDMIAVPGGSTPQTQFLTGSIAGAVTDMSAQYSFTLTPGDSASGTSVYNIVPAPGVLALLGLGGVAITRRRR